MSPGRPGRRAPAASALRCRDQAGQATVEFVLVLPLVLILMLGLVQVAVVVRAQVLVQHAAREAARAAAVDPDPGAAVAAGNRVLSGVQVAVGPRPPIGGAVRVVVSYQAVTDVPIIGPLLPDLVLRSDATMRAER